MVVTFVVDTNGLVERSSVKVLRSSNPLFTEAVTDVLHRMRFSPAQKNGRKVRQLTQLPFNFALTR